jgi:hypothetical protein
VGFCDERPRDCEWEKYRDQFSNEHCDVLSIEEVGEELEVRSFSRELCSLHFSFFTRSI